MRRILLMLLITVTAASNLSGAELAGRNQVVSATLANGMQIIIWPDHDIPNVAMYNFVKVGSRNEVPGKTGLAHFFEHMMFNGTSTRSQGEFDRIMESAGGSNNAYTSEDVTVYEDWFPGTALATVFELEADRLQHLAFVPAVVESERGVVYSERRLRVEDDNESKLGEQVQAAAFMAHPYAAPVIGWPADIQRWKLDDLKQFFTTHYAPNNCTLVLVGDVNASEVMALARRYLEPIPAQSPPEVLRAVEPPQEGERRVTLKIDAQTPLLQMAFHIPAVNDAQFPALELLLRILVDGDSSRLHQSLVEHAKVAIGVNGDLMRSFDPGLMWLYLSLPAEGDVARAEALLDTELQHIAVEGVTERELGKARNIVLSEFWQRLATIDGKAGLLGHYAVFHQDYGKLFAMPDRYAAITAADVQKVAQQVLVNTNRTVGVVIPEITTAHDDDTQVQP